MLSRIGIQLHFIIVIFNRPTYLRPCEVLRLFVIVLENKTVKIIILNIFIRLYIKILIIEH